jgi:hypothetical protein
MIDKPYDEYVSKSVSELIPSLTVQIGPRIGITRYTESYYNLSHRQLSGMIADAWLAGLAYSLDLIEEETKSPLRMRLRDMPKKFEGGGKMQETIIWENCR